MSGVADVADVPEMHDIEYVPAAGGLIHHSTCQHPEHHCSAALNIRGEHFACDMPAPHNGWAHSNKDAEAIWQGDV
jgi:hypothetical protein